MKIETKCENCLNGNSCDKKCQFLTYCKLSSGYNWTISCNYYREVESDNKFKVTCLECGSEDVYIQPEIDYDYDENPTYTCNYYFVCKTCGNTEE